MDRLEFDCNYDLIEKIETALDKIDDDYPLVSVYGHYDIIKTLLEDLITEGFSIENEIQLEDYEVSHYDKEFVLYVQHEGINVEKVYESDRYYYGGGDISFVHEDCSSTLLKYIESDIIYEFGYTDEGEDEFEDEKEHEYTVNGKSVSVDEYNAYVSKFAPDNMIKTDDKAVGNSKEIFKVNGKVVDKDVYEKTLSAFEDMYLDNIQDMLLRYADFMDNWNEWLKLLY